MKGINTNVLVLIGVIAFLYFGGFGSTLFVGGSSSGAGTEYISRIVMQEEQATVDDSIVEEYAVMLTKSFRFENGTVGNIPYFYGAKATDINEATGLERKFGTMAWGTNSSGEAFYETYGLDCSGYTSYVMYLSGIRDFPHGSSNQYAIGASVPLSEGQTGDLLIYRDAGTNLITHIGYLIVNDGKYYDAHCNAADDGIKGRRIEGIGTKANGYYWQEVVKNPYVTH